VVRNEAALRSDLSTLANLMIDTPSGAQVPLESIASIEIVRP
jgi:Cu/Ag efflux pump CusA